MNINPIVHKAVIGTGMGVIVALLSMLGLMEFAHLALFVPIMLLGIPSFVAFALYAEWENRHK